MNKVLFGTKNDVNSEFRTSINNPEDMRQILSREYMIRAEKQRDRSIIVPFSLPKDEALEAKINITEPCIVVSYLPGRGFDATQDNHRVWAYHPRIYDNRKSEPRLEMMTAFTIYCFRGSILPSYTVSQSHGNFVHVCADPANTNLLVKLQLPKDQHAQLLENLRKMSSHEREEKKAFLFTAKNYARKSAVKKARQIAELWNVPYMPQVIEV